MNTWKKHLLTLLLFTLPPAFTVQAQEHGLGVLTDPTPDPLPQLEDLEGEVGLFGLGAEESTEGEVAGVAFTAGSLNPAELEVLLRRTPVLSLRSRFPTPGNQGRLGTCVGWAIAYLKSYQEAREQFVRQVPMMSPAYIYSQVGKQNCRGTSVPRALNALQQNGIVLEEQFPYQKDRCMLDIPESLRQVGQHFQVVDYQRLPEDGSTASMLIKGSLLSSTPVLVVVKVYPSMQQYRGGTYRLSPTDTRPMGLHAMVVTGFNEHTNTFEVINSWGKTWGDAGYWQVDYDTFRNVFSEGYVVNDLFDPTSPHLEGGDPSPAPAPGPQPDALQKSRYLKLFEWHAWRVEATVERWLLWYRSAENPEETVAWVQKDGGWVRLSVMNEHEAQTPLRVVNAALVVSSSNGPVRGVLLQGAGENSGVQFFVPDPRTPMDTVLTRQGQGNGWGMWVVDGVVLEDTR